jgi:two-component system LytT family response regulator
VKPTALIVDDEALARQKLRDLVDDAPLVEVVGEAGDANAAIAAIERLRPDLVFLDVEMPGGSGLEVLERVRHRPLVIFTTAHDRYAVAAFELAAVDYLLKPFGIERFRLAVERAVAAVAESGTPAAVDRARAALARSGPLRHLFVRERGRIVPLLIADIERFEARGDYVAAHLGGRSHLLHVDLQDLEEHLAPESFVRIHRSHLVNLRFVKALIPTKTTRLEVELKDGSRLVASRARSRALRHLMR